MTTRKIPGLLDESGLAKAAATKQLKGYGNLTAKARQTLLNDPDSSRRLANAARRGGGTEDGGYDPQTNQITSRNTMRQNVKAIQNPGKATRGFRK